MRSPHYKLASKINATRRTVEHLIDQSTIKIKETSQVQQYYHDAWVPITKKPFAIKVISCRLLDRYLMRKLINIMTHLVGRLFGRDESKLSRSKLVGMYLTRTNHNKALSIEMQRTRQRRNGKFSTKRERL